MKNKKAFTLIELLMVIAIIGILAGILIPAVGGVRKQANIAASKSQLANYVKGIEMFKGDYGYYPLANGTADSESFDLNNTENCTKFIKTLTGRDAIGNSISSGDAKSTGNRRRIAYIGFTDSDFFLDDSDEVARDQLADRFNNIEIVIEIDTNGDGFVKPNPNEDPPSQPIRTPVTAYVNADELTGAPAYTLWD